MALSIASEPPTGHDDHAPTAVDAPQLRLFVMALFFVFGGITSGVSSSQRGVTLISLNERLIAATALS